MIKAALSMCGWTAPIPARLAIERTRRWAVPPVEALAIVTQEDRSVSPFTDGEVDRSGRTRDQRNEGGFVALAHDPQHPVAPFEGHVLDVGVAGFAHPQAVQPE